MRHLTILCLPILLVLLGSVASAEEPISPIKAPFPMPQLTRPSFPNRTVDIRDFGAIEGGKKLCTEAIAKAIISCANDGGGRVVVPKGKWLTGPIHLKSNIDLHISEGAEVRFSERYEDYLPVVLIQRGGVRCYNYSPLIYAIDCENIAVTGPGKLNGQGKVWWKFKDNPLGMSHLFSAPAKGIPVAKRVYGTVEAGVRSPFIQTFRCKNVLFEGFTITNSPSWCLHPVYCENVIARRLRVVSLGGPNGDGFDPDSCKNVLIEQCYFSCGDDCIILKAGRDEEAWELGIPCENVVVRHCYMRTGHAGVGIGSEMSAGVRNVYVHDCHFDSPQSAIRIKSCRGRGGVVENVWYENIHIGKKFASEKKDIVDEVKRYGMPTKSKVKVKKPQNCIRLSLVYPSGSATKTPPVFRNFHFKNITGGIDYPNAVSIFGLPESPIENIHFENVDLTARKGVEINDAKGVVFEKFKVHLKK